MSYEIGSYQDPRLQPLDSDMTGCDYFVRCEHADACMQRWKTAGMPHRVWDYLGCGEDCEKFKAEP